MGMNALCGKDYGHVTPQFRKDSPSLTRSRHTGNSRPSVILL